MIVPPSAAVIVSNAFWQLLWRLLCYSPDADRIARVLKGEPHYHRMATLLKFHSAHPAVEGIHQPR
jgi:hypothetical protein